MSATRLEEHRRALLRWYRPRRRLYPWRRSTDPYAILVSEIMLQQTQAPRVAPAFERFLTRFPTVRALAGAAAGDVIRAWDGLGYNRRAVSLHRAARVVVAHHAGLVPRELDALVALPGVGPYTAAAVAAIAYRVSVAAIDTNVARVVGRISGAVTHADVRAAAEALLDRREPGAWNQAIMDLGRSICVRRPDCAACPIRSTCRSADAARPPVRRRTPPPFEGSTRQLRGAVVGELRGSGSMTVASLASRVGRDIPLVLDAVRSLHADGLLAAERRSLDGRAAGRVRLP
jgi:A/G-specific adenine glycosylase